METETLIGDAFDKIISWMQSDLEALTSSMMDLRETSSWFSETGELSNEFKYWSNRIVSSDINHY